MLSPTNRQVEYVLLTRLPLSTKGTSYDLHVLSIPPAFILSQDQTLILKFKNLNFKPYHFKLNRLLVDTWYI